MGKKSSIHKRGSHGRANRIGKKKWNYISRTIQAVHGDKRIERRNKLNELKLFENQEFGQVRVINQNGEPYFVLKDVCEVLGLTNASMIAGRLDDDEVTKFNLGGLSGETNIVNESGLYSVILRSDKPQAKQFKKWITAEVIPSIRKHGAYMTADTIEKDLDRSRLPYQACNTVKGRNGRSSKGRATN